MARQAVTGKSAPAPYYQQLTFSISEFCASHNISVDTYFKIQRNGTGPKIMKVGSRTLISAEAAAAWRAAREVPAT